MRRRRTSSLTSIQEVPAAVSALLLPTHSKTARELGTHQLGADVAMWWLACFNVDVREHPDFARFVRRAIYHLAGVQPQDVVVISEFEGALCRGLRAGRRETQNDARGIFAHGNDQAANGYCYLVGCSLHEGRHDEHAREPKGCDGKIRVSHDPLVPAEGRGFSPGGCQQAENYSGRLPIRAQAERGGRRTPMGTPSAARRTRRRRDAATNAGNHRAHTPTCRLQTR